MNRSVIAIKNSSIGVTSQIISIVLQFVTRSIFIKYLGVEMLGLSSTFTSVLGALSVAELGFQTAVTYHLYKPIVDDDKECINDIINIYKLIYRCIGIFFIVASLVCVPLLPFIVNGIEVNNYVRCIFLLQAAGSACTYFLAYKRSLLYADQKAYISTLIDMVINVGANIVQIFIIIVTQNYFWYLLVKVAQVYLSNILVHFVCSKKYPYLHKDVINKDILKKILSHVKDVFSSRISNYIYTSTDSLVISAFVGTIQVGFFNNYTIITNNIKIIANSITTPISPIIGNLIAKEENNNQIEVFNLYNYMRFFLCGILVLPILVLAQNFIIIWIGSEYVLPNSILFLLCADLYIHIMHSSCCDYINGNGLFRIDKKISIIGAGLNLIISILCVSQFDIVGVLVGTVISQVFFWGSRSWITFKICLQRDAKSYLIYWKRQIEYLVIFCLTYVVQLQVCSHISDLFNPVVGFIISGFICEVLFIVIGIVGTFWMEENKKYRLLIVRLIKSFVYKTIRHFEN